MRERRSLRKRSNRDELDDDADHLSLCVHSRDFCVRERTGSYNKGTRTQHTQQPADRRRVADDATTKEYERIGKP